MTEKICTYCDRNRRVHSKGKCKSCYDKELKERDPSYRERQMANAKQWRLNNTDKCKQRDKERWADPEYVEKQRLFKWNKLLESYGLDQIKYDQLVTEGCQICKATAAKKYHLDHCHTTGKFRGLLCSKCNNGLGMLGDNSSTLIKALDYLLDFEQEEKNQHTKESK